ncbi:MAG: tRNA (adenosine(37)-N6)-threonylcarbamoyltransferase complex transferase subunit TsaD, partial [Chlamydiota bacterium]
LPYPGGPQIERLSFLGNPRAHSFHPGKVKRSPLDFSFSGLKTNVLYTVKGQDAKGRSPLNEKEKADIAASFQETALLDIANKASLAAQTFPCQAIFLGGGVCNNQRLRALFAEKFPHIPVFWPPLNLSVDNAAMIAGLGYQKMIRLLNSDPLDLEVATRIPCC